MIADNSRDTVHQIYLYSFDCCTPTRQDKDNELGPSCTCYKDGLYVPSNFKYSKYVKPIFEM
jgi:hypothetical protein